MGDGKALQMGTSHELGQNFAKAFDITYLDADGAPAARAGRRRGASSTRMVGGLIMAHGDDAGLRGAAAPRAHPGRGPAGPGRRAASGERAAALAAELRGRRRAGRARRPGRRRASAAGPPTGSSRACPCASRSAPATWPRATVTLVRRDTGDEGARSPLAGVAAAGGRRCSTQHPGRHAGRGHRATRRRAPSTSTTLDEAVEAAQTGFARLPWAARRRRGRGAAGRQAASPSAACMRARRRAARDRGRGRPRRRRRPQPTDRAGRVPDATVRDGRCAAILQRPFRYDSSPFEVRAKAWACAHAFRLTDRTGGRSRPMSTSPTASASVVRARSSTERDLELVRRRARPGRSCGSSSTAPARRRPRRASPTSTRAVSRALDEARPDRRRATPSRCRAPASSAAAHARPLRAGRRRVGRRSSHAPAPSADGERRRRRARSWPPTTTASPSRTARRAPATRASPTTTSSGPAPSSSGVPPRSRAAKPAAGARRQATKRRSEAS